MARLRVQEFLDLNIFTPGRRAWAARCMKAEADKAGFVELSDRAQTVIANDAKLVSDYQRWNGTRNDADAFGATSGLARADQKRDRSLAGLHRELQNNAERDDPAVAQAAQALLRRIFPRGADAIINAPYLEETMLLLMALGALEGDLAPLVATAGVGAWVKQIHAQNDEFTKLFGALGGERADTWNELKQRDRAGQEAFAFLIVHALVDSEGMTPLRTALLAEVENQHEALRELYRQPGTVPDVDPETGAVVR